MSAIASPDSGSPSRKDEFHHSSPPARDISCDLVLRFVPETLTQDRILALVSSCGIVTSAILKAAKHVCFVKFACLEDSTAVAVRGALVVAGFPSVVVEAYNAIVPAVSTPPKRTPAKRNASTASPVTRAPSTGSLVTPSRRTPTGVSPATAALAEDYSALELWPAEEDGYKAAGVLTHTVLRVAGKDVACVLLCLEERESEGEVLNFLAGKRELSDAHAYDCPSSRVTAAREFWEETGSIKGGDIAAIARALSVGMRSVQPHAARVGMEKHTLRGIADATIGSTVCGSSMNAQPVTPARDVSAVEKGISATFARLTVSESTASEEHALSGPHSTALPLAQCGTLPASTATCPDPADTTMQSELVRDGTTTSSSSRFMSSPVAAPAATTAPMDSAATCMPSPQPVLVTAAATASGSRQSSRGTPGPSPLRHGGISTQSVERTVLWLKGAKMAMFVVPYAELLPALTYLATPPELAVSPVDIVTAHALLKDATAPRYTVAASLHWVPIASLLAAGGGGSGGSRVGSPLTGCGSGYGSPGKLAHALVEDAAGTRLPIGKFLSGALRWWLMRNKLVALNASLTEGSCVPNTGACTAKSPVHSS